MSTITINKKFLRQIKQIREQISKEKQEAYNNGKKHEYVYCCIKQEAYAEVINLINLNEEIERD